MARAVKLFINLFLSSLLFNYCVEILVLLLNPHIGINNEDFLVLFIDLYLFYGPLWFIAIGLTFVVIQFFSEKKYSIGIFKPPTLVYFLSFTVLTTSFILYLNYDYYFTFLEGAVKFNFIRILLVNLVLIITGIVFVFYKKVNKKWLQMVFLFILIFNMLHAYSAVISGGHGQMLLDIPGDKPISRQVEVEDGQASKRRKIRIVLMDGISLSLIKSLTTEQKLLNFNEIIKQGVSGNIETFEPNLDMSMLNTALTGLRPSQYSLHSHDKFKFTDLDYEFDVRPRFIFFRKSANINTTAFYKRNDNYFLDNIRLHYENADLKTVRVIRPSRVDSYSEKALHRNNRFVPLFPDLLRKVNGRDPRYETLKRCFFYDDYLKNMIPDLKDSDTWYTVVRLPGLGVISKYFYQYHMPQIFGNISPDDIVLKRYGNLVEKYYEYYDSILGNLMSTTGDDELLVIMSFFQYEPLPVWRRILVHLFGDKDVYVYKSLGSPGTILMYEKNALKQDYPLKTVPIYDIYPTLLYYAGFQLPRDLQGEVLREIFNDEFLLNTPIDINTGDNMFNK